MRIGTMFAVTGIGFLILKLAGVGDIKDWSWWWVLSPWWIWALGMALFVSGAIAKELWDNREPKKGSFADGKPEGWLAEKLRKRRERKAAKWASE